MKTIRLFVDGHVFDGPYQGSATFLKGIYGSMIRSGMPFELYIGAQSEKLLVQEPWIGANVRFVKYQTGNRYFRLSAEIPYIICKYQIDYAHFQYFAPLFKNCKWIVTTHDILFNDFPGDFPFSYRLVRNILFRHSAKLADIKTTVSNYSRMAIARNFGIPVDQVHLLPNGVDPSFFETYIKSDAIEKTHSKFGARRYLLYVSRLEPRKNHETLVRAFFELELDKLDYQLVFIGHQTLPVPDLDRYIKGLPSRRRSSLRHFDNVSQSDLVNFYRAAEVFVYPSSAEGFGIPPLEAIALNIPTLCSNATAMADFDFLGDGLFAPDDLAGLKRKIISMLGGGISQKQLGAAQSAVESRYSWDVGADRLRALILNDHSSQKT